MVSGTSRKISVPALATALVVIAYGIMGAFVPHVPDTLTAPVFIAAVTGVLTFILDYVIPEKDQASPTATAP